MTPAQVKRDPRRVWKRATFTGYIRPKRVGVRERERRRIKAMAVQRALMEARLAEQILTGAKSLDTPEVTEVLRGPL